MRRSFLSAMCAIVLLCAALLFVRGGGALRRAIVLPAEQSAGLPPLIRETPRFLPLPPERERLNLNTAAKEELSSLPGIGPTLAGRIVDYRDAHGPFASTGELEAVKGVGPALRFALEGLVTVGESSETA